MDCFSDKMSYVSVMVTAKQKPVVDSQKMKRGESASTTENQFTKPGRKKGKTKLQNSQKAINKMTLVSSYLPIIILNVNGLNSPVKRQRVAEWIT